MILPDDVHQQITKQPRAARPVQLAVIAAIHADLETQTQAVLHLKRALEERDEELAAARAANRQLMSQLNPAGSL